jgi:Tfp pilus assembly protein PilX
VALVIALSVLGVTNLLVVGAIASAGDDALIGRLRLDSIRAFYAAESGAAAALRQYVADDTAPLTGTITLPGGAEAEIVDALEAPPAEPGTLVVEGRSGLAARRLTLEVQ